MKKFMIAGSSLTGVIAAASAGAVDITLGGTMDLGVDFGLTKPDGGLKFSTASSTISLSIAAAGTTDSGIKFGGSFSMGSAASLEFDPYLDDGKRYLVKATVDGATDIQAAVYNVSGGQKVSADEVVAVKINSTWRSVGDTRADYLVEGPATFSSSNICKVAGQMSESAALGANIAFSRATADGANVDLVSGADGYMPAGRLVLTDIDVVTSGVSAAASVDTDATGNFNITAANSTGGAINVALSGPATAVTDSTSADAATALTALAIARVNGKVNFANSNTVSDAVIYAGPFMEVQLASSTTKLVVGAVCVQGLDDSDAAYYMDNVSKIMTVGDASIYVEGGFGKLTLKTSDHAGAVKAIAGAGDQADISAGGLIVVAETIGLLGVNPFLAVDLAPDALLGDLDVISGATVDLGSLNAAIDVKLGTDDLIGINHWDLGLNYTMGDISVAFAADSASDWGLSAYMAVAGVSVDAEFGATGNVAHQKSGIAYSVVAATQVNGLGLSFGVNQSLQPSVGLSYDLGGLNLYAGYDVADEGGALGAKLSF